MAALGSIPTKANNSLDNDLSAPPKGRRQPIRRMRRRPDPRDPALEATPANPRAGFKSP